MRQHTTLRLRLMISFVLAALVPLVVATMLAVPWYQRAIETEASRSLETGSRVSSEMFAERVSDRKGQVASVARVFSDDAARAPKEIAKELQRQSSTLGLSYLLYVDESGVVRGSTTGEMGHRLGWSQLQRQVKAQEPSSFAGIVPVTELVALGQDKALALKVKKTEGGSAPQSEAAGALSIVAVAPVRASNGKRVGAIVGVETVKLNNDFVDSVTSKVGGVATVFQNGVRVATTVKDDAGQRAVGTAISDKVRAAVLKTGKPFQGNAFVVNREYLASYEPITDLDGKVIGMLFVGLDRTPYATTERNFALGMAAVTLLGVIIAIVFGAVASASLAKPIVDVSNAAEKVATGDLTVNVPVRGFREAQVMGESFNSMTMSLRSLIGNVNHSVRALNSVSGEISSAATLEAEGATSQASSVAEATATIEELDRSFAAVADGARRVLEIAEDSLEVAESGRDTVGDSTGHVERLANGASVTLQSAGHLANVADDIDQVTFVIGSIAEQTKILALNAAIEAARAGEAGKGFGVVASEIRNLADSVSTSVGRIEELVHSIQDASRELAATAERQAELGHSTVQETARTRDKFDEIYERMSRTASAAREIATAASQQQSAARQIVGVMQQVSQGVSGTAAQSRHLAESASDIKREASTLSGGLQGFKID